MLSVISSKAHGMVRMHPCTFCRQGLCLALALAVATLTQTSLAMLPEAKLAQLITALQADSLTFPASDMGVQRFAWNVTVDNPRYPHSPKQFKVRLLMYVKYTFWQGKAYVKGFLMADTRDAAKTADGVPLTPIFTLQALGGSTGSQHHNFTVEGQLHSYWDPPKQAAMVYGFDTVMQLPASPTHEYHLSTSLNPSTVHLWRPYKILNLMDGRGLQVPPITQPTANPTRPTYIILKHLDNFNPTVYGPLIERHLEYYQALGVDKTVLYLRREHIISMLFGNKNLYRAAQQGRLIAVEWDGLAEHEVWHRQYDQRVIYSHAMLSFTTMDVYLLNVDLNEYLVTSRPELQDKSIQEIINTCAGDDVVDLRVAHYPVVCQSCERDKPETQLWAGNTSLNNSNHPLSWYHLINYHTPAKRKSIVNPNFLRSFYVHYGVLIPDYEAVHPEQGCMMLLHIPNMVRVREESDLIDSQYVEDHSWMGTLRRFSRAPADPQQTTAAGSNATAALAGEATTGRTIAVTSGGGVVSGASGVLGR